MSRKKTLLCLIWAFLLLLIPAVGASAATELQYVYLTPSEDGSQTGVIVALNGTEPESASLDYGTGTVKASEISGNHLVFLVPGSGVTEKNLKSLTIEKNSDKETIRLTSFFRLLEQRNWIPQRKSLTAALLPEEAGRQAASRKLRKQRRKPIPQRAAVRSFPHWQQPLLRQELLFPAPARTATL